MVDSFDFAIKEEILEDQNGAESSEKTVTSKCLEDAEETATTFSYHLPDEATKNPDMSSLQQKSQVEGSQCDHSTSKGEKTNPRRKQLSCDLCDYKSSYPSGMKSHMRTHTGEKPYACKLCDYKTRTAGQLTTHMKTHSGEKPYSCEFCDFRCLRLRNLKEHIMTHTGEKPYACKICDYRTRTSGHLSTHLKTHTGEKPYACEICDFRCFYQSILKEHMRTHTGEKPYACDVCDFRCKNGSNLASHKKTHSGEKPFTCEICQFKCRQASQLKVHKSTHALDKNLACSICDYKCSVAKYLKRHMRIHTDKEMVDAFNMAIKEEIEEDVEWDLLDAARNDSESADRVATGNGDGKLYAPSSSGRRDVADVKRNPSDSNNHLPDDSINYSIKSSPLGGQVDTHMEYSNSSLQNFSKTKGLDRWRSMEMDGPTNTAIKEEILDDVEWDKVDEAQNYGASIGQVATECSDGQRSDPSSHRIAVKQNSYNRTIHLPVGASNISNESSSQGSKPDAQAGYSNISLQDCRRRKGLQPRRIDELVDSDELIIKDEFLESVECDEIDDAERSGQSVTREGDGYRTLSEDDTEASTNCGNHPTDETSGKLNLSPLLVKRPDGRIKSSIQPDCSSRKGKKTKPRKKQLSCDLCDFTSSYPTCLKNHMRTHTGEKPFVCEICGHRSSLKKTITIHMMTHTGEKPFACKLCDYRTKYSGQLTTHMKIHTGEKPYSCEFCTYRCIRLWTLKEHIMKHTGEKPYACDDCDFRCSNGRSLIRHKKIHSGEKPFTCEICQFKCSQASQLNGHKLTHAVEKNFACTVCDYKCSVARYLKRHMRTHAREEEAEPRGLVTEEESVEDVKGDVLDPAHSETECTGLMTGRSDGQLSDPSGVIDVVKVEKNENDCAQ